MSHPISEKFSRLRALNSDEKHEIVVTLTNREYFQLILAAKVSRQSAEEKRQAVEAMCKAAGIPLPPEHKTMINTIKTMYMAILKCGDQVLGEGGAVKLADAFDAADEHMTEILG